MPTTTLQVRANQLLETAQAFYEHGQIDSADLTLQRILHMAPRHFGALYLRGIVLFQQNKLDESYKHLKRAVRLKPGNLSTLYNLGVISQTLCKFDEALDWYDQAIKVAPRDTKNYNNKGRVYKEMGLLDEAKACYEQAIEIDANYMFAYNNLSVIQHAQGDYEAALENSEKAIALSPSYAEAYNNKASALIKLERYQEALTALDIALAKKKDFTEAYFNQGTARQKLHDCQAALNSFFKVLELLPDLPDALFHCADLFLETKQYPQALAYLERLMILQPDNLDAQFRLGVAYWRTGQADKTRPLFDAAVATKPTQPVYFARAYFEQDLGLFKEAIVSYQKALELDPFDAATNWNLALCHLTVGEFEQGWEKYEWRWENKNLHMDYPDMTRPVWTGKEPLEDKTLLLHYEQGLGDSLHFFRYVLALRTVAKKVILVAQPALKNLFTRIYKDLDVVTTDDPQPEHDFHLMLMSAPLALQRSPYRLSLPTTYLRADPFSTKQWEIILKQFQKKRIGLVWTGNPKHTNDRNRSMPIEMIGTLVNRFSSLADFFCIQKEVRVDDQAHLARFPGITFLNKFIDDFTDTAGICSQMDLIISVDTSVAHLTGAMGKPTWIMIPQIPDWRWRDHGFCSDWYPSVRLLRQGTTGSWESIMPLLVAGLDEFLNTEETAVLS